MTITTTIKIFAQLLTAAVFLSCSSKEKPAANELPNMTFTLADDSQVQAKELEGKVVLIFFQPDCDHCHNETKQIKANLQSFKKYTVYFASSANMAEIQHFGIQYKMLDIPNMFFVYTPGQSIIDNYGPIAAPSLYIYDDGKLVHSFNGEVEVDVVKKYL
jgi:peroxiredoxin